MSQWPIDKIDMPDIRVAMEDGDFANDCYWAYQMLSKVKDPEDAAKFAAVAPTPGAAVLLEHACKYRRDFFKDLLPRSMNRRGKDTGMKDDGRKFLEIIDPIYSAISEKYLAKRECPMCGRQLTKHTVLFRRPKKVG